MKALFGPVLVMLLVASLLAGVACTGKIYVTPTPTPTPTPTSATPETPTLMSPRDGASLATTRIVFQWSTSSGATKYALEVNTDQNWGTATRFYYADVSTNYVIVDGFPANGTKYYWHVSAGNSYGWSPASTTSSLVNGTQVGEPPEAPALSSPADGSNVGATTSIAFQWSAPSGTTHYLLEVNIDQNWGTATRFCYADVSTNSVIVAGFPANGTKYYWHVSAGNSYGWSPASTTSSVVNGTQGGAPTATPTSSSPADGSVSPPTAAPSLLSPPNGTTVIGHPVTFTWNPVSGATKYLLKVFRPDGSQVIALDVGGVTTYTATSLPYHVSDFTYYWVVWAGNGAGWCPDAAALANQCHFTQMYRS